MKRIGLICLALVLALGVLGVGYAMWKDEVTIEGTVNTGSVEIEILALSETYVYKNVTSRAMVMSPTPLAGADLIFVASATAEDKSTEFKKKVTMNFTNIFPTNEPIEADVKFHYNGTIPVHVALVEDSVTGDIGPYLVQTWETWNGNAWVETDIDGIQLHQCEHIWLKVSLNATMLQNDGKEAQGLTGTFTKTIVVHQWNEEFSPP